ncbi:MAG: SpoIIE family protein phosphatase [Planctomycetes bacterium]|nr:SpoIIE family protein phosphatase [Planctomycetota bacterium]
MPLTAMLAIKTGVLAGSVVSLGPGQSLTIGRTEAAGLLILDRKVSRVHCRLEFDGSACHLQDLGGQNGTFVNGARVKAHTLASGDELRIGDTLIIVEVRDPQAAPRSQRASGISSASGIQPQPSARASGVGLPPRPMQAAAPHAAAPSAAAASSPPAPAPAHAPAAHGGSGITPSRPGAGTREPTALPTAGARSSPAILQGRFCDGCDKMILQREIAQGSVREVGGKVLCRQCGALAVGGILGPYRILEVLGRGSLGIVLKAEQVNLRRVVVLKVLLEHLTSDVEVVAEFQREAMAAATLSHPNIVQFFDAREDQGFFYHVMEFVPGTPLLQWVAQNGPFPVDQALDFLRQMTGALQYAFHNRIVHRDLCPANILYTPEGIPKVIDMGTIERMEKSRLSTGRRARVSFDVLNCAAPEQIFAEDRIDHRADIYSLGATTYYLLAGELPYQAATPQEFRLKITSGSLRPLRELRPEVPEALAQVVERMMRRDPNERYQAPDELLAALESVRTAPIEPPPPQAHEPMPAPAPAAPPVEVARALEAQTTPTRPGPTAKLDPATSQPAPAPAPAPAPPPPRQSIVEIEMATPEQVEADAAMEADALFTFGDFGSRPETGPVTAGPPAAPIAPAAPPPSAPTPPPPPPSPSARPPEREAPLQVVVQAPADPAPNVNAADFSMYDVNAAKEVQAGLAPTLPEIANYELGQVFKPAKAVGGDYVDFFQLDDGRYAALVADVAGKGLSGALVKVMVRSVIRMIGPDGRSPADTLIKANRRIIQDIKKGMFVSMVYGILDPVRHTFQMANAGHNPPAVWRAATGKAEWARVHGMVLGVHADRQFEAALEMCTLELGSRDRIVLYSDGVTEAKDPQDEDWTEERLLELVEKGGDMASQALLDEVMRRLDAHRSTARQSDDITMLAMRRMGG